MKTLTAVALVLFAMNVAAEEAVRVEAVVQAPREAVWKAWTTEEGVKSFFAPAAHIELRPDGWYEILFDPKAPAGQRGADGNRVMLVQEPSLLAFTWNAPSKFPGAQHQHTHVMVRLSAIDANTTRVVLTHDGFGEGEEWAKVRSYFEKAWGEFVLPSLVRRFAH